MQRSGATPSREPRVLVIEDDLDLAFLLATVLSRGGCSCSVAHTLAESRGLIATEPFDVLVVDLFLPDGKGTEILSLLETTPNRDTPVIVSSGNTEALMRSDPRIAQVLQKPYNLQLLLNSVRKVQ